MNKGTVLLVLPFALSTAAATSLGALAVTGGTALAADQPQQDKPSSACPVPQVPGLFMAQELACSTGGKNSSSANPGTSSSY